jgi:hypothetical protein
MKLSKVLNLYTKEDVNEFLKSVGSKDLSNPYITDMDIKGTWRFVGDNEQNASTIDVLENGEKGIIERLTNGIDAVLERKRSELDIVSAKEAIDIVKKAFPKYYNHYSALISGHKSGNRSYDANNAVTLAVNDGSKKISPTFDIIDMGTGLRGVDFPKSILSLHGGNKVKKSTSYLIGAFGQGGSTSLAFAYATMIISKYKNDYFFTLVMKTHLADYKNHAYVYLVDDNKIIKLENDIGKSEELRYLDDFIKESSGTLVRMVDLEITKRYRERDIAKPRMLGDYFNIELFRTPLPIQMIENREYFKEETKHHQNRYVYGTKLKLQTWKKNVNDNYSGYIEIVHKDHTYKIDFYTILPSKQEEWINDNKCRENYEMFNIHEKPIFFTVNGQYINGEYFTKLANRGLSYLKYRLLVHIDLDLLGNEKYRFFTTDRSRIKDSDLTSGFIDKVVKELSENKLLNEINDQIAQMSIDKGLDDEALEELKNDVKNAYEEFLHPKKKKTFFNPNANPKPEPSDESFNDYIEDIIISNKKEEYYRDESIRIILKTEAYKYVNESAEIKAYIDGKEKYIDNKAIMNGRIQYIIDDLKPGEYKLHFIYFYDTNMLQSNNYVFTVLNEKNEIEPKGTKNDLDIHIDNVNESELIVSVAKDIEKKQINIKLCLTHPLLEEFYVGKKENDMAEFKSRIAKPICLIALYMGELYDDLNPEKQNKLIQSFVATLEKEF